MPAVLGLDLGTTTITALALDADTGDTLARATAANQAETTPPAGKARGHSEWDADAITRTGCACLRAAVEQLGGRRGDLAGLGLTGQQHGVVVVDENRTPLTPFINWQDRRAEQADPGTGISILQRALERAGADAPLRTGCRLAAGYLAVTLFGMKEAGVLPPAGTACFLPDLFAARLTGRPPVTDPTCAASGGAFNLLAGDWDPALLAALGLSRSLLPDIRPSGALLGPLTPALAESTGLPAGLPVFVGIGDNQASFLGGVADRDETVLVNVGTGGQVAVHTGRPVVEEVVEARPFPGGGYLAVCAGLSGGRAYAALEGFFRQAGAQLFGLPGDRAVYAALNRLAAGVPCGADGLRCEPFFAGMRHRPEVRGSWTGVSLENLTPGHLARALLEGMARAFRGGYEAIRRHLPRPRSRLVGAGNGLRENPLLAGIVAEEMGLPLRLPRHREEAAFGAALLAAAGAGLFPDLAAAGRLIRYTEPVSEPSRPS